MKYLALLLAVILTACSKQAIEPKPNYSATEYRIEGNVKWVSIHFHSLTIEEQNRFKTLEALGMHKICPEDEAYSLWRVGIDTCVHTINH